MSKFVCPLCDDVAPFSHIIEDHREFWETKYPTEHIGEMSPDEFNRRFVPIGFTAKKVEEN